MQHTGHRYGAGSVCRPRPLATRLTAPSGPLFFPVTAYATRRRDSIRTSTAPMRCSRHRAGAARRLRLLWHRRVPRLTPEEFAGRRSARPSRRAAGRVLVLAGAGYGTALAVRCARLAEEAGADGLLAMPPYLVFAGQEDWCGTTGRWRPRPRSRDRLPARQRRVHPVERRRTGPYGRHRRPRGRTRRSRPPCSGPSARCAWSCPARSSCTSTDCRPPSRPSSPTARSASPLLVRRVLLRPRDRPRLPPGARDGDDRPRCTGCSTASTGRSSN